MSSPLTSSRTAAYQPGLAWFAAIGGFWVFVLVMMGAFTTSIGAGMIFPDWPLSNGSLNPDGWLTNIAMFAEHSHRLSAGLMSLITLAIAAWIWRREARGWVRKLAYFAVALVLGQALVGGLRVLLDHLHVAMVDTSVGRLFAMLHACLAQIYVCTLLAIAMVLSRRWIEAVATSNAAGLQSRGRWCVILLMVQLAIAAVMRHSFAGLAIPTFPLSNAEGDVLPQLWNFRVGINFAHRVMALVLTIALVDYVIQLWRTAAAGPGLKLTGGIIVALLVTQITLGASVVWLQRNPFVTTGHVIVGACLLATTFGTTLWTHRGRMGA